MIGFLVLALGVVAILTTGGVGLYYIEKTTLAVSMAGRNVARMDEIATVLRANLWIDPDGVARAPLGDADASGVSRLPEWIVGGDTTPWGARYAYCPLAPTPGSGTGQATVGEADGVTSYTTSLTSVNEPGIAGRSFVVATQGAPSLGGPDAGSIVGMVLSPAPGANIAPDCGQVVWANGFYTIDAHEGPAGSVVMVSAKGTLLSSPSQGLTSSKFDSVVFVAPAAAGDGSGSDSADPMAYADAYAYWLSAQPRVTTFELVPGAYQLTQADAAFRPDVPVRAVRFVAEGSGVVFSAVTATTLRIGTAFTARGVTFGANISVAAEPGAELGFLGSSVSALSVKGGEVDVDLASSFGSVSLSGGRLRFADLGTWLQPAATGTGVTAGEGAPVAGSIVAGPIAASGGEIVVDGVALNPAGSAQGQPALSGAAKIILADGGSVGGSSAVDEQESGTCTGPDAFGRYVCSLSCDAGHPFVKKPSCPAAGAVLTSFGTTEGTSGAGESYSCGYRADQPLASEQVVVPVDGQPSPGAIGAGVPSASYGS